MLILPIVFALILFIFVLIFFKRIINCGSLEICNNNSDKVTINNSVIKPKSVNYHFTRKCNYECGFCFHTAKTSFMLDLEDAKIGLKMLKNSGMEKINFSGGEPFLPRRGKHLGEMVKFCKKELKLPSVSIVSNGSLITEKWFQEYGEFVDIMAISCDSFNEDINQVIGRGQGNKNHVESLKKVKNLCKGYNVLFKINTVVNTYNKDEDMTKDIEELEPVRWKVFQCLLLEGENVGPDALRNAQQFYITKNEFNNFIQRHNTLRCLVPESNTKMQNSYLILDEYMRFLDCTSGNKTPSKSILDIGVAEALKFSGFDEKMFKKRGGLYKWSKEADSSLPLPYFSRAFLKLPKSAKFVSRILNYPSVVRLWTFRMSLKVSFGSYTIIFVILQHNTKFVSNIPNKLKNKVNKTCRGTWYITLTIENNYVNLVIKKK